MTISCIIVEDEPLALERAKEFVARMPFLQLIATFDNGMDAWVYLKTNDVQLIFLDINMGEFSGIHLLESAAVNCQVIMTTAYPEYALKGFDLKVTDYLLKPYTFERFVQAVERAESAIKKTGFPYAESFIFIKTANRLEKLLLNDILYIEGMRDYRRIHTVSQKIMTLKTFADFEREISPAIICRIHKSYMVAVHQIESIVKDQVRIGSTLLPVSETYKKAFGEIVKNR